MLDVSVPLIGSAVAVLPVVAKEPPEAAFSPLGAALLETVLIRIIETNVVGPMSVTGSILLKAVCISAGRWELRWRHSRNLAKSGPH